MDPQALLPMLVSNKVLIDESMYINWPGIISTKGINNGNNTITKTRT